MPVVSTDRGDTLHAYFKNCDFPVPTQSTPTESLSVDINNTETLTRVQLQHTVHDIDTAASVLYPLTDIQVLTCHENNCL